MLINFIKKEIVLDVAFVLALVTAFIIPPSEAYISYIDFRTLSILLSLMLITSGFQAIGIFDELGEKLVRKTDSARGVSLVLVFLCFFSSMIITNDVALLTFVPFTIITLNLGKRRDLMIPVIVLETIAANLGSMTTPIGNPQNLYLYNLVGIGLGTFLGLMLPYTFIAGLLLFAMVCINVKKAPMDTEERRKPNRSRKQEILTGIYLACFALMLLVVARILDYRVGLLMVVALVFVFDIKRITEPDYSLIFTFVFLFIFIGNIKQIPALKSALEGMLSVNEVIVSAGLSQVISNVPAAILCSGFTDNIKALIVGTNIGGLGTLIASMASLISFKLYGMTDGAEKGRYFKVFTIWNILFLAVMLICYFVSETLPVLSTVAP